MKSGGKALIVLLAFVLAGFLVFVIYTVSSTNNARFADVAVLAVTISYCEAPIDWRVTACVYGLVPDSIFTLDWGDGTVVYPQCGYGQTVSKYNDHRYCSPGEYTVTVTQNGESASCTIIVTSATE